MLQGREEVEAAPADKVIAHSRAPAVMDKGAGEVGEVMRIIG